MDRKRVSGTSAFIALLEKDLRLLVRGRRELAAILGFALLLVVVSSFAFRRIGFDPSDILGLLPGVIWVVFLFTGVVTLNHTGALERENRAIDGVVLAGVPGAAIFASKCALNTVVISLVQIAVLFLLVIFFGVAIGASPGMGISVGAVAQLLVVTVLATIGFSSFGTVLSMMAVRTAGRELLLPLLLFPLCFPLLAGSIVLTQELFEFGTVDYRGFWFVLLLVIDMVSLSLGLLLTDYVVKD